MIFVIVPSPLLFIQKSLARQNKYGIRNKKQIGNVRVVKRHMRRIFCQLFVADILFMINRNSKNVYYIFIFNTNQNLT